MFSRMKTYRIWRSWKVHINVAGRFGSCHFVYGRNVPDLGTLHAPEFGSPVFRPSMKQDGGMGKMRPEA